MIERETAGEREGENGSEKRELDCEIERVEVGGAGQRESEREGGDCEIQRTTRQTCSKKLK